MNLNQIFVYRRANQINGFQNGVYKRINKFMYFFFGKKLHHKTFSVQCLLCIRSVACWWWNIVGSLSKYYSWILGISFNQTKIFIYFIIYSFKLIKNLIWNSRCLFCVLIEFKFKKQIKWAFMMLFVVNCRKSKSSYAWSVNNMLILLLQSFWSVVLISSDVKWESLF